MHVDVVKEKFLICDSLVKTRKAVNIYNSLKSVKFLCQNNHWGKIFFCLEGSSWFSLHRWYIFQTWQCRDIYCLTGDTALPIVILYCLFLLTHIGTEDFQQAWRKSYLLPQKESISWEQGFYQEKGSKYKIHFCFLNFLTGDLPFKRK